jgi:hypothetical protein
MREMDDEPGWECKSAKCVHCGEDLIFEYPSDDPNDGYWEHEDFGWVRCPATTTATPDPRTITIYDQE